MFQRNLRVMNSLRVIIVLLIAFTLTAITQIGGLVYLISLITYRNIDDKFGKTAQRIAVKIVVFVVLYLISVFLIVPMIARPFGRVPLPLKATAGLEPGTIWTFLLNRNYVKPLLKEAIFRVA